MRVMHTTIPVKDVVRSHISYFGTIYHIHLCFTVLSFFLNSLASDFCYKNVILVIHSWHVYKHTVMWGSEDRSNTNFSPTSKKVYTLHKIFNE